MGGKKEGVAPDRPRLELGTEHRRPLCAPERLPGASAGQMWENRQMVRPTELDAVQPRPTRLVGVDVARAAAIVGMVMVHFWSPPPDSAVGAWETVYSLTRGRASILFAVLAAVGVVLASRTTPRGQLGHALLGRCLVLVPLGLALQVLHDEGNVILQFYAVYLALAWLALWLPPRVALLGGLAWILLGPVVYLLVATAEPAWVDAPAGQLGDPWWLLVRDVLLTGAYPAVTWGGPLLLGIWLGRQDLWSAAVRWRMVWGGAGLAMLCWGLSRTLERTLEARSTGSLWEQLVLDDPHSQMPLWLLGATATAAAALGVCLLAADALPPAVVHPLDAFGRLALTAYVLHLLLVACATDLVVHPDVRGASIAVLAFAVAMALGATLWLRAFDRGPLEWLARAPHQSLQWHRRRTTSSRP